MSEHEEGDDELTAQAEARVGQVFGGKWTLRELIGVGGWAAVYKAVHRNGAQSAIKVLHPQVVAHREARDRFLREAYIANKVGHPGTVAVIDDDLDPTGAPYLVMELLVGETAEARAARAGGCMPLEEVTAIAEQTLAVLEAAHAQGIVHRDIKPDNLFLTNAGTVKLLDFGIARLRDTARSRTKTGTMIGTPGFMSPEQAMGRMDEIDARTDLWALGATMFTLLTGQFVHEGETVHEMLIHAATRPARSLGRAMPHAPVALVEVVDRALEYDQPRRYPDARSMRVELARAAKDARAGLGGGMPARASAAVDRQRARAPEPLPPPPDARPEPSADFDLGHDTSAPEQTVTAMRELFARVEKAIVAKTQYGAGHPEATRRVERMLSHARETLARDEDGLIWSVNPYSFLAGDETVWEPDPPLNRIPYQLFSDGIRLMGLLPGLSEDEFNELVRIFTIDPVAELAPEDDLVTLLWDACFEHVVHVAIDPFTEGDQQTRARFERERQAVVALARKDTSDVLKDAWQTARSTGRSGASAGRPPGVALAQWVATAEVGVDTEARARVARLELPEAAPGASSLQLPSAVRAVLAAKMHLDIAAVGERFVIAAAHAFMGAEPRGNAATVTIPLRASADSLAENAPEAAIEYVLALCRAVEVPHDAAETERLRPLLAGAIVSPEAMRALLTSATREATSAEALGKVLAYLDATLLPVVLAALRSAAQAPLRRSLLEYVGRVSRGHEAALGKLLPEVQEEVGVALVRVLATFGTPAATEAIAEGARSPHPVVRIEALGHLEGVSSERLRLELRALLEDRELSVRLAALRAMAKYRIRVAGPFLVLRVRSSQFDGLSLDERREALMTLATLAPARAEAVATALLGDSGLLSSEAHEQTRELAAEVLGQVGSGAEVIAALTKASKQRFRGSDRVRVAASKALEQVAHRKPEDQRKPEKKP